MGEVLVLLGAMCIAGLALGQIVSGQVGADQRRQPYTAEYKIATEKTSADGTTIKSEWTERVARDFGGRVLTESIFPASGQQPERTSFRVNDPVARTNVTWSIPGQKLTIFDLPPPPQMKSGRPTACWASDAQASPEHEPDYGSTGTLIGSARDRAAANRAREMTRIDLGTDEILWLEAHGWRTTRTVPAGEQGNEAPRVVTSEVWIALSDGIVVRSIIDDPRSGRRTKELVKFDPREPDAEIFQTPDGYEVRTIGFHEAPCSR